MSNSIVNQKKMLEEYADKLNLVNYIHFTDDGISGTRFDRPSFLQMIEEVNNETISCIIVKDMSRIGRDYLKVGEYMELFRQKGVRLIAINDNVDTFKGEDDFTPFRNIMNEWYARDTSRKIKSTFKSKGMSGKPTTSSTPYGYIKDPNDNNKWIVDEVASKVVKRIFTLCMQGKGPYNIARILEKEKVEIPAYHQQKLGIGLYQSTELKYPYRWCSSTIASILRKKEYLGHTVNFKTKKHFKDKKSKYVDEDKWFIFENTHEPIIDEETFNNVQRIRNNVKRYLNGWGEVHILSGLMYCFDCGSKMYVHRTSNYKNILYYACSNYTKVPCGSLCSNAHRIKAEVVIELIKSLLKEIKERVKFDKEDFIKSITINQDINYAEIKANALSDISKNKKRVDELEKLVCRIYEDMILEKIPSERYEVLSKQYSIEKNDLVDKIYELKKEIEFINNNKNGTSKFLNLVDRYNNFDDLNIMMMNEFVEKIVVHERERKGSQTSK